MIFENRNYLKTSMLKDGDVLVFESEGEWLVSKFKNEKTGEPNNDFYVKADLKGVTYDFKVNGTNRKILISLYGKDSKDWMGNLLKVTIVKTMVGGKMFDTPVLEPVDSKKKAKDPKEVEYQP